MRIYRLRPVPPDRDPQMREMIGLAKGFVCDGSLNDAEGRAFYHIEVAASETPGAQDVGEWIYRIRPQLSLRR